MFLQLSPNVIMGLHQMAQAVQSYDYQSALGIQAQLVATGNFSEIGHFMPGIKVLMQSALKLGV